MSSTKITELSQFLAMDSLTGKDLKDLSFILYKMNVNPLPIIRKYIERSGIDIAVHYMEGNIPDKCQMLERVKKRKFPLIILYAMKMEGEVRQVKFYEYDGSSCNLLV